MEDGDTLTTIECSIYEIHDLAEAETEIIDSDNEFATRDYFVDSNSIRENNKDGRLIYRVLDARSESTDVNS
jgi:hypothetical protein